MENRALLVNSIVSLADSLQEKARALRVHDVATLLNVSQRQVYKLAAENRIPAFRIGGSLRFDPAAIAAWLRNKMPPSEVLRMEENTRPFRARS